MQIRWVSWYIACMENFLKLSTRIFKYICILTVLLSALTYVVDMPKDKTLTTWAILTSLIICAVLIVLSVIAKQGLKLIIRDDDRVKAFYLMRVGLILGACLLIFCIFGLAMGISTGAVSYLYVLLVPAVGLYLFSLWKVRPAKSEIADDDGREFAEPLYDVINEIPDRDFYDGSDE